MGNGIAVRCSPIPKKLYSMQIGDKVRFLNDVGGGVITGFQDKQTVLVSDADGFEIPTLIKDVVVVETDNYNIAKKKSAPKAEAPKSADPEVEAEETDLADLPLNYTPLPQERRGAEALNLCLAFVPAQVQRVPDTTFDVYLVNDCNYYFRYVLFLTTEGETTLRHEGELAPNTKLCLETLHAADLQQWERPLVQTLAYKRGKACQPKPPMNIQLRPDLSRFFKLHTFQSTPFFRTPAWQLDIVRDDEPAKGTQIDAQEILEAMQAGSPARDAKPSAPAAQSGRKQKKGAETIEVDLHAHSLLDTLVGLQPADILDYQLKVFTDVMEQHKAKRGQRIVFIHGKGNGVLRQALLKLLQTRYSQCRYQDASFREYGFGATLVTL